MTMTTGSRRQLGDQPPRRELVTDALLATWAYLRTALHRPSPLTAALAAYGLPVLAAIVIFHLWWMLLAFPALFAVSVVAMFAVFARSARAEQRTLLVHRSAAGRAGLVLRTRGGADGEYLLLENMWARSHGARQERAQRPGGLLLARAIELADQAGLPMQLVAADQALAAKLYVPAGFTYLDERQRTRRRPRLGRPARAS